MNDSECGYYVLDWTNLTATQIEENYVVANTDKLITTIVLPIIVSVGLLTNMSYMFTFSRTEWMKGSLYINLLHLSCVDSLTLALAYGQRLYIYLRTPLNFSTDWLGDWGCVAGLSIEMLYYASLVNVTLISVERFYAVCHPLQHMKSSNKKRMSIYFAMCWLFSVGIAALQIPQRFYNQIFCIIYPNEVTFEEFPSTARICLPLVSWYWEVFSVLQFTVFYTCLIINLICYGKILAALSKRPVEATSGRNFSTQESEGKVKSSQNSATRMILVNGSVYFLCNAPVQLFLTMDFLLYIIGSPLSISPEVSNALFSSFQVLIYINSSVNPIIYSLTNRRYRSAMWVALGIRRKRGSRSSTSFSTLSSANSTKL